MRGPETPLEEVIESFLLHRSDLSEVTAGNYRRAIRVFVAWCERELGRSPLVADIEPGTVEAFLRYRKTTGSAESARVAWVALRSLAKALADLRIHHEGGESVLRRVRQPKVKDEQRRNLTDAEMYRLIERASEGENACRDRAIVMTFLGTGIRRAELIGLRLCDVEMVERQVRIRASTSKSVHPRDIALYPETLKELDRYIRDFRADGDPDDALFIGRRGGPLTAQTVKRLFDRLKLRTGIRDLSAHTLRHTWATNFNRSGTGSAFDLQMEGGWTTPRMVQRYAKVRPLAERRRAPSPFTASRLALPNSRKHPAEMRPSQQRRVLSGKRTA
jgi:site-specific recombinase XerD